eukprot:3824053-Rhodomonas_salina.1
MDHIVLSMRAKVASARERLQQHPCTHVKACLEEVLQSRAGGARRATDKPSCYRPLQPDTPLGRQLSALGEQVAAGLQT